MKDLQQELNQLQQLHRKMNLVRRKAQRLRDQVGLHSVNWDAMPKGSGPQDKIGDLVPEIADAETELQELEEEYEEVRERVSDWINKMDDLKAGFILSLRYLEGMGWEKIADECTGSGDDPMTGDAVRKYVKRYLGKWNYKR